MSLHDPFVIAHAIEPSVQHMGGGAGLFLCISNIWMLLNVVRVINSGWNLRLFADVTYKPCQQAIAVMGFAVNSMGGKHHLVALSIIPDGGESAHYYGETWKGICASLVLLLSEYKTCDITTCTTCNAFRGVQEHPTAQAMLVENPEYHAANYRALPLPLICNCSLTSPFAGLTNITAAKARFESGKNFQRFMNMLMRSRHCAFKPLIQLVEDKLVEWLYEVEEGSAASWYKQNWCGGKGRFHLGHVGMNAPMSHNGLESIWRHLKAACGSKAPLLQFHQFMWALWSYLKDKTKQEIGRAHV